MNQTVETVAITLYEGWLQWPENVVEQRKNGPHPPWANLGRLGRQRWLVLAARALKAAGHYTGPGSAA